MIGEALAVREAGADALPAVMRVMGQAFDPAYGEAWSERQCAGMLGNSGAWLTLGEWCGEPAGFALARAVVDEAELLLIAVTPAARGHGLGRALLEAVRRSARARGVRRLFLEMRAGNPAVALYDRSGFRKVGERRDYYRGAGGASFDALSYSCQLTD